MKLLKNFFFTIVILFMMLCGFILVCALNPALTEKVAGGLYGKGAVLENVAKESTQILPDRANDTDSLASDREVEIPQMVLALGTDEGIDVEKTPLSTETGYMLPQGGTLVVPKDSMELTGYEQIHEDAKEVEDAEAKLLQEELDKGKTGEDCQFDTDKYPYYHMLTPGMQCLYRQIYANAMVQKVSFAPVVEVSVNQLKNVIEAVYNDQPQLFWLDSGYSCKYQKNGSVVEISLQYNELVSDLSNAQMRFAQAADAYLFEANKLSSNEEKEQYIHDALVQHVEYDKTAPLNQSAYSALVNGKTVCAGYAKAYQYLLQQLDIPCYYCTGYSGEDHAWNIVKMGNGYTNVDVTWDDTDPATYDYYQKTDAEMRTTHIRKGLSVYLPACGYFSAQEGPLTVEGEADKEQQKPLEYDNEKSEEEKKREEEEEQAREDLSLAGIKAEEVLDTLEDYYADCERQLEALGSGYVQFSNVIPASLWNSIETAYSGDAHMNGYVKKALDKLEVENFAIQLQGVRLSKGYYRLYHNISTW